MSELLLEITIKATLVTLATMAVTAAARRWSAAGRHLVWAAALAVALLVPLTVAFGPRWVVAVRVAWPFGSAHQDPDSAGNNVARGAVSSALDDREATSPGATVDIDALFPRVASGRRDETPRSVPLDVGTLWLVGIALALIRLAGGHLWAAAVARRATALADTAWLADAVSARASLGVGRQVQLLTSGSIDVPAVWGVFRPKLLLPAAAVRWTAEQRRAVLLHELAHVRRGDGAFLLVARLAAAVHWFNPLVMLAGARLRAEQERACDDLVLGTGLSAADYAQRLCELVQQSRRPRLPMWAAPAMGQPSRLEARVRAMLDPACRRQPPSWRARAFLGALAAATAVPLAAVRPVTSASQLASPDPAKDVDVPVAVALADDAAPRIAGTQPALPQSAQIRASVAAQAVEPSPSQPASFLSEHCTSCHNETRKTANVTLDLADLERVDARAEMWEKVVRRLRSGTHPPSSVPAVDPAALEVFVSTLEAALDRSEAAHWGSDAAVGLSGGDVAARLATFLWGAPPDRRLAALASGEQLRDPATVRREVRRMLNDTRAVSLLTGFFDQWLLLGNIDRVKPDPARYPEFDEDLRKAFRRETELFVQSQVRDDRPVPELLRADYTFVNERLARHYGISGIFGDEFRRVRLADDSRAGLLGKGSLLAITSYAERTSPVLRGAFVLRTFFGTPPPPPPPNVPALKTGNPDEPSTLRTRMEAAVKAPVCASCHSLIDPLGFALENFDAVGRWRNTDAGLPIDASGAFATRPFRGPAEFRLALLERSDAFVRAVTERLLSYALDRPITHLEMPAVRTIVRNAAVDGYRWSSIITGVVVSTPFQTRRLDTP
jgi:beta-lactamase regulating signal transducer with metallopeptidase domain